MKKISFLLSLAVIALAITSCGGEKQATKSAVEGDIEIVEPCTGGEYNSNKTAFRATGYGFSNDRQLAKNKAKIGARAELSTSISVVMKRVSDSYASSYQMGENEEAKQKFEDMVRQVVKQKLEGSVVICDKLFQDSKTKGYRAYVTVELSAGDLVSEIKNRVANDDKLRIDYEYEKYKAVFDEEMNKLANE